MSSITSETNTVQMNSTEETKVNLLTNGNQIPNDTQMPNENQMEELHIVNETTHYLNGKEEQSESRQSEAGHPSEERTSTEQSGSKTRPSEHVNKYGYSLFDGYEGEGYLHWILRQILPYALYRTWSRAVSFQAPGNACYVGATRIAQQEKAGVRKIEIDLAELEARGLMKRTSQRQAFPQQDGTVSYGMVKNKDFGRLYDLAYEYHLWTKSPEYVPAERESAEEIKKDVRLYLKLMRFDNYRHILTCQKPGPKAKRTPLQEIYHCQLPEEFSQEEPMENLGFSRTGDPKPNLYLNVSENDSSPYRESNSTETYFSKENSTSKKDSEERGFADVVNTTIRNEKVDNQTEKNTEDHEESKIREEQRKQEKSKRRERSEFGREQSNNVETQQKEEMSRENAKASEEYDVEDLKQNPMTMIAFLLQLNEQERSKQEQQQAKNKKRHHKDQPKRKRLGTPEHLARTITQMVQDLGGNPQYLQSDITRITKLYWACTQIFTGFTNSWFLEQLTKAFIKTCKARKVGKRVPYFFKTLEGILELTNEEVAYIRSQKALYRDGNLKTFVLGLQQSYHRSGSQLEYQQWVKETYL